MIYDEENDYYICAYGKKLLPVSGKIKIILEQNLHF